MQPLPGRKILILANPFSGRGKAVQMGRWILEQLIVKKISASLFIENWPTNLVDFTEVWLVGGDGTLHYFANHYPANSLPLVLFKGGTGNDFAWKLYGDISLERNLEIGLNNVPQPVDAAMCNGTIYVNSAGLGFDGEILKSMKMIRYLGGHLGYLLAVIKNIFTFSEGHFIIKTATTEYHGFFLLVAINNSSRTGGGFLLTPGASVNDGLLDMLVCKPLKLIKRLRYLPVIEKGKHINLPFIVISREKKVFIEAGREIYGQLDGEIISGRSFLFEILPAKLLVRM